MGKGRRGVGGHLGLKKNLPGEHLREDLTNGDEMNRLRWRKRQSPGGQEPWEACN